VPGVPDCGAKRLDRALVIAGETPVENSEKRVTGAETRTEAPRQRRQRGEQRSRLRVVQRTKARVEARAVETAQPVDEGERPGPRVRRQRAHPGGEEPDLDLEVARLTEQAPQAAQRALDRLLIQHRAPQAECRAEAARGHTEIVNRLGVACAGAKARDPRDRATQPLSELREVRGRRLRGGAARSRGRGTGAAADHAGG
jgi:hypothetical protein